MSDPTEGIRRVMVESLNLEAAELEAREADPRAELEKRYGQVWSTEELRAEYEVTGFLAPFVAVTRLRDGKRGAMLFSHMPRFYHSFQEI